MLNQKRFIRMFLIALTTGTLLLPAVGHAEELRLNRNSLKFSDLDGSAMDLDGVADGTLTLDGLALSGNAEIVVDRARAVFAVAGDFELSGRSAIRPASNLQVQGPQIEIRAGSIHLAGRASLRADGRNAGGSLRLCAGGEITIEGSARIFAQALDGAGLGGSISLESGQKLTLLDTTMVRASGGSGGSIKLVSCAADGFRRVHSLVGAAIMIHGGVEAVGTAGAGGRVEVDARKGGIDFRPPEKRFPVAINANGATSPGSVSITTATRVAPLIPPTRPAATVAAGSPSNTPCDCSGGGGGVSSTIVAIDVDRTSGVPGTLFKLSGRVVQSTSTVDRWQWKLTDGRELTGQTISVSFQAPGLYGATLTAIDRNNNAVQVVTGVQVFNPATQGPPELGLPAQVGDVDGDGVITLKDAHLVAKHAGRLQALSAAAAPAADIDLDGQVTPGDALQLGQAVAAGQPLPSSLSPVHGAPGVRVNLISPNLLDPTAKIEIEVGQAAWLQQPLRPARGYATFIIPLDATQRGSLQVVPGPVEVRIRRDGAVVETFTFQVDEPPPLPADPKAALTALLADYTSVVELNQDAIRQLMELSNVGSDEKELLLAAFTVAHDDVAAEMGKLRALLDKPNADELAKLFFLYANANGYPDYRKSLSAFLVTDGVELRARLQDLATGKASVDDILSALCLVKKAAHLLDLGGQILGWSCDALFVAAVTAAVVTGPADALLLYGWATTCGSAEAFLEVPLLLNSFITKMDADLRFKATPETPQPGEAVKLQADVELIGIDDLCSFTVGQGTDKLIETLAKKAVERFLTKKLALPGVQKVVNLLSKDLLMKLEDRLAKAVGRLVGETAIGTALEDFTNKVCDNLHRGAPLPDDLSKIMKGPEPNVGTVTFASDGTAQYTCPDQSSSPVDKVTFTATRKICDETTEKKASVTCKGRPVTITMGDNGPANDDIFEVRIEGRTVLTSNQPVRSISTTVNLQAGDHTVEMIGRAAPDGVGTYFIEFSGATVIGGDPLSGTDLTPGVVKTFQIRVQ
ncbi:MAG: PKD domain-containing protein [Acidobacteria bacterium]|nr:PKD domain-containing protein [Acidobacteriota bacterium]